MNDYIVIFVAVALTIVVLAEIVAAALPVLIVITAVPPEEREGLARLLAACDSSRRLRLWPALRLAVRARRGELRRARREKLRENLRRIQNNDEQALGTKGHRDAWLNAPRREGVWRGNATRPLGGTRHNETRYRARKPLPARVDRAAGGR